MPSPDVIFEIRNKGTGTEKIPAFFRRSVLPGSRGGKVTWYWRVENLIVNELVGAPNNVSVNRTKKSMAAPENNADISVGPAFCRFSIGCDSTKPTEIHVDSNGEPDLCFVADLGVLLKINAAKEIKLQSTQQTFTLHLFNECDFEVEIEVSPKTSYPQLIVLPKKSDSGYTINKPAEPGGDEVSLMIYKPREGFINFLQSGGTDQADIILLP